MNAQTLPLPEPAREALFALGFRQNEDWFELKLCEDCNEQIHVDTLAAVVKAVREQIAAGIAGLDSPDLMTGSWNGDLAALRTAAQQVALGATKEKTA